MRDNELIALVLKILYGGQTAEGISGTLLKQAFQPTRQGVETLPAAYIHKIGDRRYGYVRRTDCWDAKCGAMVHTEIQQYETTFQISALATQKPNLPTQLTASDICNACASILQSQSAIEHLNCAGAGIERVTDIRNPYFMDDREQPEANPSFDFVLTYDRTTVTIMPSASKWRLNVAEV